MLKDIFLSLLDTSNLSQPSFILKGAFISYFLDSLLLIYILIILSLLHNPLSFSVTNFVLMLTFLIQD